MTPFATALWLFVAALAFSAAVVRHVKSGEVNWGIAAAGVFLLAMGISSLSRRSRGADRNRVTRVRDVL